MPASASDNMKETFGKRLKAAREKAEMTQREFAEACDWAKESQNRISMYEKGKRWPALDDIMKMAAVLDVSAQHLIFGDANATEVKQGKRLIARHKYLDSQLAVLEKLLRLPQEMREPLTEAIVNAYAMWRARKATRSRKEAQPA